MGILTVPGGLLASATALAQDELSSDDVDFLELAAVLIQGKSYEKASGVLASVDLEDKNTDKARFYRLRGLVRMNLSLYSQAAEDFEKSITERKLQVEEDDNETFDNIVYVNLGQAYFFSEQFEKALKAFSDAGDRANAIPSTFKLRSEAYTKLERYDDAWRILGEGMKRHPDFHELLRRRAFLAIRLQLYQAAAVAGRAYLDRVDAKPQDYQTIGAALSRSGNKDEAIKFLELARLRFPASQTVASELARLYKSRGQYRTAALMLERASLMGADDLAVEAGELYRQAGELFRALALNGRIADSKARLRQRLGLLLELRRYEMVAIMDNDLKRVGLLRDEPLRYAIAYAHFKTGNYDRADQLLSGIKDPSIFRQATDLRKAMADCRKERWRC
ncbi:MAG: hypothetical protein AAGA54_35685 [Myxococcota bacterium]